MGSWKKMEEEVYDYLDNGQQMNENVRVEVTYVFEYNSVDDLIMSQALKSRLMWDTPENRLRLMRDVRRPNKFYCQYIFYKDDAIVGGDSIIVDNTDQSTREIIEIDRQNSQKFPDRYIPAENLRPRIDDAMER